MMDGEGLADPNPASIERVTDPAQVAGLIKRLRDHHALLTIRIPGHGESYLSAVLDVNLADGYVLLDELVPASGHAALMAHGRLQAFAHCSGVDISFAAQVLEAGTEAKGGFYRIALPSLVHYQQRRAHYRARIRRGQVVPVLVPQPQGELRQGLLHDISIGGLGGEFGLPDAPALELGQVVANCELCLSAEQRISVDIEVRYLARDHRSPVVRLGARFVDLPRAYQRLIEQFVAAVDREWRRKTRSD